MVFDFFKGRGLELASYKVKPAGRKSFIIFIAILTTITLCWANFTEIWCNLYCLACCLQPQAQSSPFASTLGEGSESTMALAPTL